MFFRCFGLAHSATSLIPAPLASPAVLSSFPVPLCLGMDLDVCLAWLAELEHPRSSMFFRCFGLARSATSLVSAPFAPPAVPSTLRAPLRFGLDVVVPLDLLMS